MKHAYRSILMVLNLIFCLSCLLSAGCSHQPNPSVESNQIQTDGTISATLVNPPKLTLFSKIDYSGPIRLMGKEQRLFKGFANCYDMASLNIPPLAKAKTKYFSNYVRNNDDSFNIAVKTGEKLFEISNWLKTDGSGPLKNVPSAIYQVCSVDEGGHILAQWGILVTKDGSDWSMNLELPSFSGGLYQGSRYTDF